MSNLYQGASIDASYQVWVHLVKRFHRRRFQCETLTDRRRMPSDDNYMYSSHGLWQAELKINYLILSVTCGRLVVSSNNKTDRHDITEILLKAALNTIKTSHIHTKYEGKDP
jgi:hypothetical protein